MPQNSPFLITQSGLDRLNSELTELRDTRRPQVVERLSIARSMGDLAENSDYISAKEELSFLDGQISELEELSQNAKVATPTTKAEISFGHAVTVQINGTKAIFHIVGEWEADPAKRLISHASPIGLALLGKKVGDKVEVDAPVGKVQYTIVGIE